LTVRCFVVLSALVGLIGCGGCSSASNSTPRCFSLGAGTIQDVDWAPNGRWLGADLRSPSGETAFIRRGPGDDAPAIVATIDDDIPMVTITDDGTMYYYSTGHAIAVVGSGESWDWGTGVGVALDWTPAGLIGLFDTGEAQPHVTLARIGLDAGKAHLRPIQDVAGTVDFGLASSPDGNTLLVGTMTAIGSPVQLTLVGPRTASLTIADAGANPVALWTSSSATYAFYRLVSDARVHSSAMDGAPGPRLDTGTDVYAFDVSADGTYAAGPVQGNSLCVGHIGPTT
jgi:hypothetical protein